MKQLIALLLFPFMLFSQTVTETKIAGQNAVVYKPAGYDSTKKYKTIIAFPGLGEQGTDIKKLYIAGPARFLRDGVLKPDAIVICVQPTYGWVPLITYERTLAEIWSKYKVDSFALTGLSAGASALFNFLAHTKTTYPICAIVPLSFDVDFPDTYNISKFTTIRTWGICGTKDSRYVKLKKLIERLAALGYPAKFTSFVGGHCCWQTYYDPAYKENGESIYDFMIGKPKPVIPPPQPVVSDIRIGDTIKLVLRSINDSVYFFERIKN